MIVCKPGMNSAGRVDLSDTIDWARCWGELDDSLCWMFVWLPLWVCCVFNLLFAMWDWRQLVWLRGCKMGSDVWFVIVFSWCFVWPVCVYLPGFVPLWLSPAGVAWFCGGNNLPLCDGWCIGWIASNRLWWCISDVRVRGIISLMYRVGM